MKLKSILQKIFSVMLVVSLFYSFLGNVLATQLLLALADHSHHTESVIHPEGIQISLVHGPENAHPDHEIHVPCLNEPFLVEKGSFAVPDLNILHADSSPSPLVIRPATAFIKLPEKRSPPHHTHLRSIVIIV